MANVTAIMNPPQGLRATRKISPELQTLVLKKFSDPRITTRELLALAELCEREGAAQTAAALRARAAEKTGAVRADAAGLALPHEEEDVRRERGSREPEENGEQKTIVPGVPFEKWITFEKAMVQPDPSKVETSGRLGIFGFAPKRLVDLGIAKDVEKSPAGKWTVTKWGEGWSEEKLLSSPKIQRKAFRRSMREYARSIMALYKDALGKKVHDKPVTLSGLLAVAHIAGGSGLATWVKDRAVREKFPQTTRVFLNTTGMF